MLRINQFAKEIGESNNSILEVLEKRLGIKGKSHSSNLTPDQVALLRRHFEAKAKGVEEAKPLAIHRPTAPVRVVKGTPTAQVVTEPAPPVHPPPVLVKKQEQPEVHPAHAAVTHDAQDVRETELAEGPEPITAGPEKSHRLGRHFRRLQQLRPTKVFQNCGSLHRSQPPQSRWSRRALSNCRSPLAKGPSLRHQSLQSQRRTSR